MSDNGLVACFFGIVGGLFVGFGMVVLMATSLVRWEHPVATGVMLFSFLVAVGAALGLVAASFQADMHNAICDGVQKGLAQAASPRQREPRQR